MDGRRAVTGRDGRAGTVAVPLCSAARARNLCGLAALALGAWLLLGEGHHAIVEAQEPPGVPRGAAAGSSAAAAAVPRALSVEVEPAPGECAQHEHEGASHSLEGTLCFLVVCCLLCSALDHWNVAVPAVLRLPISVVIFIAGMVIGVIFLKVLDGENVWGKGADVFMRGMQGASFLDPHALFYVLLPPLLYESASNMSWHVLRKVLPSAWLLALPGVVLNSLLVGFFARGVLHVPGVGAMSWEASLLLASVLSATDPVAVVAALHSLGAPKKLATLIEGESLLNDGSAVVFFGVFLDMVATGAPDSMKQCVGMPPSGGCVTLYFLRLALGGPALGMAVGAVLYVWISWAGPRELAVLEISVVLAAVYGAFFLAESIHVSGVLAVVTLGILVSASVHARLSHKGRHAHHTVLSQVCYTCNHVIFFSAGSISARFMWTNTDCTALHRSPSAWVELVALYLCLHVTRALIIALFSPLLVRLGYGVTWKECTVMVWGGLRGAIGLAMGLMVEHNAYVDRRISDTVAFHVSGIVLLTLLINGSTVDSLYHRLQLYPPNPFSMTSLRRSLCALEAECSKAIVERMLNDWFFEEVDFDSILGCVPDFSHIEFGAGRVPYPGGIRSVRETLQSLESSGTRFYRDLRSKQERIAGTRVSAWDELKEAGPSHFFGDLQEVANTVAGKDCVANVVNTGDERFEYRAADADGARGLYVSARPLSGLCAECEQQQLQLRPKREEHGFSLTLVSAQLANVVVGLVAGAEAAAALGGSKTQRPLGAVPNSVGLDCFTGKAEFSGVEGAGCTPEGAAHAVAVGETVHVTVTREVGSEWQVNFATGDFGNCTLGSCSLGPFPPDELYPVVQFSPRPEALVKMKSRNLAKVHRSDSTCASGATVMLSYEPHTASEQESLRQTFQVIFNLVTHHYHEVHEHGLIGVEALAWLMEAVGGAEDCAEGEVNRPRAKDFNRFQAMSEAASSRDGVRRFSVEARSGAEADRTYLDMFEPLIVEYLAIEQFCATRSVCDHCPGAWGCLRRFDYQRMLAKVEALWAFVEAHEEVLHKYSALERYPHLTKFLHIIVDEAKDDLRILAEMKPRRFWYGKHFLALRVLMTKKRETLARFAQEGWIARDDCAHLDKSLWRRIREVEHFVPQLYRGAPRSLTDLRDVVWPLTPTSVVPPPQLPSTEGYVFPLTPNRLERLEAWAATPLSQLRSH